MNLNQSIRLYETLLSVDIMLCEAVFNPETFLSKLQSVVTLARRGATEGEQQAGHQALRRLLDRAEEEAANMSKGDAMSFLKRARSIADAVNVKEPPKAEPFKKSEYKTDELFPVGTWVVCPDSWGIGKVEKVTKFSRPGQDPEKFPNIHLVRFPWIVKGEKAKTFVGGDLRRANQEEIDAALAKVHNMRNDEKPEKDSNEKENLWKIVEFARFSEGNSDKIYGIATKGKLKTITFWGRYKGPYFIKDYSGNDFENNFEVLKIWNSKLNNGYRKIKRIQNPAVFERAYELLKTALSKAGML